MESSSIERRDELARILRIVAAEGLEGPKDLDVALDAIESHYHGLHRELEKLRSERVSAHRDNAAAIARGTVTAYVIGDKDGGHLLAFGKRWKTVENGQIRRLNDMEHSELVARLAKPGEEICRSLTPGDAHLWHMASCISGEAGELFDAIKKQVIYRKELDLENIIEELGDIEFYLEGLRQELGISRFETLEANKAKLSKRYESLSYSDQDAQDRKDKEGDG